MKNKMLHKIATVLLCNSNEIKFLISNVFLVATRSSNLLTCYSVLKSH